MDVRRLIAACEASYRDMRFSAVVEWKKKHRAKAVGYMPVYVPREIIDAAGILPVGVMGAADNLEIIRGDAYFQSYICHIPRSTIELGVSGRLDFLDGMLFPAICDVIRNLSGMWQLLFKGGYVRYMDFPQNFDAALGGAFYRGELESLRGDLGELSGNEVTTVSLNRSIDKYNRNRREIKRLYDLRCEKPHLVPTSELYLMMWMSNVLEVDAHTALVEEYLSAVGREVRPERDNVRVVVTGAFCEQPPLGLIKSLESSGCYIVDDDWILGARYLLGDVEISDDPIGALTDAYLHNAVSTASRYDAKAAKGKYLIDVVKSRRAEGVIFCAPSFCDPALLERPMLQAALAGAEIPYTSLKYAENSGQFQVIREQTGSFADSIKLWGPHEAKQYS